MLPVWALVLIVLFVPGVIKMMLDSMSGQRGGFKNLSSFFNKDIIVTFLTSFVLLWFVLYFVPDIFHSVFDTTLGNLIILTGVILLFMKDNSTGIAVLLGFLLFKSLISRMNIEGMSAYREHRLKLAKNTSSTPLANANKAADDVNKAAEDAKKKAAEDAKKKAAEDAKKKAAEDAKKAALEEKKRKAMEEAKKKLAKTKSSSGVRRGGAKWIVR